MKHPWIYSWGLGAVSFGGASLLVPIYIVGLGASPFQLGLLAATATIIGAPGAVVFGRLANRASHRRRLVLATLGTATVTLAVIPLIQQISLVIVVNAVLWFVVASVGPVVTMLVVEEADDADWSTEIGILNTYYGYGWAGGLLLGLGWPLIVGRLFDVAMVNKTLFWLFAATAGLSTVTAVWTLPESTAEEPITSVRQARRIARLLINSGLGVRGATFVFPANRLYWTTRGFRLSHVRPQFRSPLTVYLLGAGLFFAGFAVFWAPLPHLLMGMGLDSGRIFGLYLLSSLSGAVLYGWAGRLAKRFDCRRLTAAALFARGVLFPVVAVSAGLGAATLGSIVLAGALLAIGISWAVIAVVGTTIATRLAPPGLRGETLGSYVAIGALAGGLGSIMGGFLATIGFMLAFGVAGGIVILGGTVIATLDWAQSD